MAQGSQVRDDREGEGPSRLPGRGGRGGRGRALMRGVASQLAGNWADRPGAWRDNAPVANSGGGLVGQGIAAAGGLANQLQGGEASAPEEAPGKKAKGVNERRREIVNGVEYVRDGSVMFPLEAVMAAGGDFNAVDPNLAISYQGTVNKRLGAGRGFQGTGAWAQGAQAAGLGDAVGAGWTQNSPAMNLTQGLMYGHVQMGANGTFVEQREGNYQILDRQGNVISSGQGNAPPEAYDPAAQQQFETQARDAIIRKGGNLAQRLQGGGAPASETAPTGPAPSTNKPGAPAQTKVINGVQYQLQPDGTWVKMGPAPTGPPQTDPLQGGAPPAMPPTTRPYQPAPAPPVTETKPGVTPGIGGMVSTLAPPPTGPVGPAMPKNPMQTSVSSYLGVPKPGEAPGGAGGGGFKPIKMPQVPGMPKMPKLGGF